MQYNYVDPHRAIIGCLGILWESIYINLLTWFVVASLLAKFPGSVKLTTMDDLFPHSLTPISSVLKY